MTTPKPQLAIPIILHDDGTVTALGASSPAVREWQAKHGKTLMLGVADGIGYTPLVEPVDASEPAYRSPVAAFQSLADCMRENGITMDADEPHILGGGG